MRLSHFVLNEKEARDFIYNELRKLLIKYDAGLITWPDVYFRIHAEPLLSEVEKQELLRSPSVVTLEKLFRGVEPEIVIDGVALPSNATIVAQHSGLIQRVINQYWHYGIRRSGRIEPRRVVSIFKAVSALARARWPRNVKMFIYSDGSRRNRDLLAVLLMLARWQGIPYYSNKTLLFRHEAEESSVYDDLAARLGFSEDAVVLDPGSDFTQRATKVLCHYVNDVSGKAKELRKELETLYGVELYCCCYGDWWRFDIPEVQFNHDLYTIARSFGVADIHAKLLAQWRLEHPTNAVRLLLRIWEETLDEDYVAKVASIVSMHINVNTEMLMEAFKALRDGKPFHWPK